MRYRVSYLMDEIWERAVETALDGQTDPASARTLTLDGAVKCAQGRLPPPTLLEKFQNLQHLSIANIGVSTLELFPRLRNLQKLILSDNRIAGGLVYLVEAGLESLRDLDLSNNRIQFIEDLIPLAQLKLVSLDLYECPVTRVEDYRSRVFGLIKSLKYLDKMDAEENERPESDDEEEEEEDEDEDDDPGCGEIDGEHRSIRLDNGHGKGADGVLDADDDEDSDADEEETEASRRVNGRTEQINGFCVESVGGDELDVDEEDDDENESGEEIHEEGNYDIDNDVVEVHEIEDSDDEEDGVEYDEEDEDEDEDDDDDDIVEEEVDNDEVGLTKTEIIGRITSTGGEIDGHEQGEADGDDDGGGETDEEEQGVDDGEFEDDDEEDYGAGYLVRPVGQVEAENTGGGSDLDAGNDDHGNDEEIEEVDDDDDVQIEPTRCSSDLKRKRTRDGGKDEDGGEGNEEDDGIVSYSKSSKKNR